MNESDSNPENRIALFQKHEIRRTIHNNEWCFVVAALTDSVDPQGYIKDMRRRDPELSKGWGQIATPLSIQTSGGKQKLNCANTEGLFRIIQSIPSTRVVEVSEKIGRLKMAQRTGTHTTHSLNPIKNQIYHQN